MGGPSQEEVLRRTCRSEGLSVNEREALLKPYLPRSQSSSPERRRQQQEAATNIGTKIKPVRTFLKSQLYIFIYTVIHTLFSIYIRLRRLYHATSDRILSVLYHHHRTPELIRRDIKRLSRLPEHLSVILTLKNNGDGAPVADTALERLMDEAAEIAAWCACARIPTLSIYEQSGVLKGHMPRLHRVVSQRFHAYFGKRRPQLELRAPHVNPFLNGDMFEENNSPQPGFSSNDSEHLSLLLISSEDGRESIVDLTKTLTEMAQRDKISPADISLDLIDLELTENVMPEPELLIIFGPYVELQGYPPWQVRLTEIFHVKDCGSVGYQVFLQALHRFAKAQMRFGR
ncbi:MAG: hypothetical protein M1823_004518 [Watsoniomyces obsoletus]|nr:MAG: hypothetical protein M1823_004518 [Watsoniomyces obsoletus]